MNSMDWWRSVREKGQKALIPPEPPEGAPCETPINPLSPPVTPCGFLHLIKNEKIFEAGEEQKIHCAEEKVETSGGHRGNPMIYGGNDDLAHRGHRGNQGKLEVSVPGPPVTKPHLPYLKPSGILVIQFDSDPRYHWWKRGLDIEVTRAEALARMDAERAGQTVGQE